MWEAMRSAHRDSSAANAVWVGLLARWQKYVEIHRVGSFAQLGQRRSVSCDTDGCEAHGHDRILSFALQQASRRKSGLQFGGRHKSLSSGSRVQYFVAFF